MTNAVRTALGIDIGGSHCRAAVVDEKGGILSFDTCPTPVRGEPAPLAEALASLTAAVRRGAAPSVDIAGVGLPGIIEAGVMKCAVNLRALEGSDVGRLVSDAIGLRALIEVDVSAAAWGQWRRIRPAAERFVYLSIGTGVGAGAVMDGELVCHTHGGPGHWGHVIVDSSPNAPRCRCGARGCLEALAGGAVWSGRGDTLKPDAIDGLAVACGQIAAVYAPQAIAFGGGAVDHRPEIVAAVAARFAELRGDVVPAELRIERAPLSSDEAGVIGAALLAMRLRSDLSRSKRKSCRPVM